MIDTTTEDRAKELQTLLQQMRNHPERDWAEARDRVAVLQRMLAGAGAKDGPGSAEA